jgi:uncharacterized protein (TIGR02246 family)
MTTAAQNPTSNPTDERAVRALYRDLLAAWNRRSATEFGASFDEESHLVGFDGSQINGRAAIVSELTQIFASHPTAAYVGIIEGVRFLNASVAVLRAAAGMVPPGKSDIDPKLNAVQSLVARKREHRWQIAVYQNTPAAFHGRPELTNALTDRLEQVLRTHGVAGSSQPLNDESR